MPKSTRRTRARNQRLTPTAPTRRSPTGRPTRRVTARSRRTAKAVTPRKPTIPMTAGEVRATTRLFDRIPEDELRAALETCDDDRALRLLSVLDDPAYRTDRGISADMATCIRAAGMSVPEILKAILSMHSTDADLRVARRLPDIMDQMAAESAPRLVPCPKCQGGAQSLDDAVARATADALLGDEAPKCRHCRNRGVVIQDADNDVRKMLLEAAGKLGVRGPLVDARSVTLVNGRSTREVGAPDMTDWSRSTDAAFESAPALPLLPSAESVKDAEVIES